MSNAYGILRCPCSIPPEKYSRNNCTKNPIKIHTPIETELSAYNSGKKWVKAMASKNPPLNASESLINCCWFLRSRNNTITPPETTARMRNKVLRSNSLILAVVSGGLIVLFLERKNQQQ